MTERWDEISKANRDFRNAVQDLLNANHNTYDSKVKALLYLINNNRILSELLAPYLERALDLAQIEQTFNGWGKLELPLEKDHRTAYGLQVLKRFTLQERAALGYAGHFFYKENFNAALRNLNEQLLVPVFREVYNMLDDLLEQNKEPSRPETAGSGISIHTLTVHGPANVGHGASQTVVSYHGVSEQIISALLQSGISTSEVDKIRVHVDALAEEMKKAHPEQSNIKRILSSIYEVAKLAVPIISTVVNHPEVTAAARQLLGL